MYVSSNKSNFGTNFCRYMQNAKVIIQDRDPADVKGTRYNSGSGNRFEYNINGGTVTGYTEYLGTGRRRLREVIYGQSVKEWNNKGKLTESRRLRPGTTMQTIPEIRSSKRRQP